MLYSLAQNINKIHHHVSIEKKRESKRLARDIKMVVDEGKDAKIQVCGITNHYTFITPSSDLAATLYHKKKFGKMTNHSKINPLGDYNYLQE